MAIDDWKGDKGKKEGPVLDGWKSIGKQDSNESSPADSAAPTDDAPAPFGIAADKARRENPHATYVDGWKKIVPPSQRCQAAGEDGEAPEWQVKQTERKKEYEKKQKRKTFLKTLNDKEMRRRREEGEELELREEEERRRRQDEIRKQYLARERRRREDDRKR